VIAVVALCWALLLRRQFAAIAAYPWQISPAAFALSVWCAALYFGGLALCWALLLRQMAGRATVTTAGARVWLASMLTRYVPGNVWHILSRAAMAGKLAVTPALVVASATIEQALTLLGALALLALTLPLWYVAGADVGDSPAGAGWLWLALPLGLASLHPALLGRALRAAAQTLRRPELAWNYRYRDVLVLLLAYVAAMLCQGFALVALVAGMVPLAGTQVPLLVGASALAWALGFLSFLTPSGLGVREGALALLLAQIYPTPVAIVASLAFRLACTAGELLAVAVGWASGARRTSGSGT
jgi:uncharacterized membrane protein YbhN (UPF0104 family)